MSKINRIIYIQPALPNYRLDYFERLSHHFGPEMKVYYSPGSLGALTQPISAKWAKPVGKIRALPYGLIWQSGVAGLRVRHGDILVLSGNPRQLSTLLLLARATLCGAHTIWWGHYWSSTSRRWRQILRHLPMSIADAIMFYTDDEVDAFRADTISRSKGRLITALNNGIDIEPIYLLRQPFHAAERDRALLFIGRLTEKAKLGLGLEAMAHLGDNAPMLHVVGDGVLKKTLQSRAKELQLENKIVWHGAITSESDIAAVANRCQAFIYPGEVGLSLIHAMAYRLPAIVHSRRRWHMPEIAAFRDDETGLSFRHDDVHSLSETIGNMLSNQKRLERLSNGSASIVGPSYTTESMAARFKALVSKFEVNA